MANTTFSGPVRSKGGFVEIDENATTGAITENISITHDGTNSVVIIKDPPVAVIYLKSKNSKMKNSKL